MTKFSTTVFMLHHITDVIFEDRLMKYTCVVSLVLQIPINGTGICRYLMHLFYILHAEGLGKKFQFYLQARETACSRVPLVGLLLA